MEVGGQSDYTQLNGNAYSEPNERSQVFCDMVAGAILQKANESKDFYSVRLPDGRKAFVSRKQSHDYGLWAQSLEPTEESPAWIKRRKTTMRSMRIDS